MGTRTFELSTTVPLEPAAAIDFLLDLGHHHGLHPLLVSADVVHRGTGPTGEWADWEVVERVPLGPFGWPLRFGARMVRTERHVMEAHVRAAPGCLLRTTTSAEPSGAGSLLRETTVVTAPRPVLGFMTEQARAAHARTYERLPAHLARGLEDTDGRMDP